MDKLEFITLDEAAKMQEGTRITFIPGVQALYAEALKNICYVKKIPIIRALHPMMGVDKETGEDRQARLYELTSQTSLPTMLHNEERPRNVWTEQLALAEAIGGPDSPLLIPEDFESRVDMFGLCAVVLAEDGLVWNMRIMNDGPLGENAVIQKRRALLRRLRSPRYWPCSTAAYNLRLNRARNTLSVVRCPLLTFIGPP